ncbi:MAG: hypothetical protein HYR94_21430 [Chloroflexi bacterium]|nr:hypothetical protein [Chloroflexota bacterium]
MTINSHPQQHEMHLEKTHPSGAEEWCCPMCGRRFLMHWQSEHQKLDLLVLKAGDELVSHFGSKGGLRIGKAEISVVDEEPVLSEELRAALEEALEDIDFDNWSSMTNQ